MRRKRIATLQELMDTHAAGRVHTSQPQLRSQRSLELGAEKHLYVLFRQALCQSNSSDFPTQKVLALFCCMLG